MSANDPTDDELEREARADVPIPMLGGNARHAPRLSTESRAINPRALLQAEAEAQSAPQAPHMAQYEAQRDAALWESRLRTEIALHRGQQHAPRSPRLEPPPPPAPLRTNPLEHAWDEYAAQALNAFIGYAPNAEPGQLAHFAAAAADALLEERKARFR